MAEQSRNILLPTAAQIHRAIALYLAEAYGDQWPPAVEELLPGDQFDPAVYLMGDATERTPRESRLSDVRSFSLRLGNAAYKHMKLRISRPPRQQAYLFVVDSHDEFLQAPVGSADYEALEELKRHNMAVALAISTAWGAAGLPTEKNYLRTKIRQAKQAKGGRDS